MWSSYPSPMACGGAVEDKLPREEAEPPAVGRIQARGQCGGARAEGRGLACLHSSPTPLIILYYPSTPLLFLSSSPLLLLHYCFPLPLLLLYSSSRLLEAGGGGLCLGGAGQNEAVDELLHRYIHIGYILEQGIQEQGIQEVV